MRHIVVAQFMEECYFDDDDGELTSPEEVTKHMHKLFRLLGP